MFHIIGISKRRNSRTYLKIFGLLWLMMTALPLWAQQRGCTVVIGQPEAIETPVVEILSRPDCKTMTGSLRVISPVGDGYEYSIDDGFSFQDSPIFESVTPADYEILVKNSAGCLSTAAKITIDRFCIPDAFSPNGDEYNQTFEIVHPAEYTINLKIFNRWGNVVFESKNYQNEWDGRGTGAFSGHVLPAGTYYYVAEFLNTSTGVRKTYTGYLTHRR